MKKIYLIFLIILFSMQLKAQQKNADSLYLISLNQQIDHFVVERDTVKLDNLYSDDFVFSHGSGRVEGKKGWFSSVKKGNFIKRQHDSVIVETHNNIAILRGKLTVEKKGKEKTDRYHLKYVRVYAVNKETWQMISHFTFLEWHE